MEPNQYFDDESDNIDQNSTEDIRKECYREFMTNLEIVYNVVKALPDEIQLEALITMMREI